ncbi:hypothetical protein SAMD00023378_1846 [Ralstonia sp. NT80]|nr:hypothetical protein SAMD00023378_1846 [Ralstonia sp. NT80]
MIAREQALVFELADVAADGLGGDAEHAGKRIDGSIAVLADVLKDLAVSGQHQCIK